MSILSIEHANQLGLKQKVKTGLGKFVASRSPARTRELIREPQSQPQGIRDKAIMTFLKRRALLKNQTGFFERLHRDFWSGKGGEVFSSNCDHRFEDMFLAKQKQDFEKLVEVWDAYRPNHIVEFGSSSGLVLNHITKNLPGVQTSTGIEINADQVLKNQQSPDFDSRIEFVHADGGEWLLENGQANTLFVTNGGVLEYFRRERLDEMLTHISTNLESAVFFVIEPVANDHDWSSTKDSIPFGEELSFSHNYTDLFESNGFQIEHQRAIEFDQWKMMATIAVLPRH